MSFYAISSFKGAFNEGVTKARLDPISRDNVRKLYANYINVKNFFDQKVISKIYVSYDSKFYVDDIGYTEIAEASFNKFGIMIEPIYNTFDVECVAIDNYMSYLDVIKQSNRFLSTAEAAVKREAIMAANKKANQDLKNLLLKLSSPMPDSIENARLLVIDFEFCHHKNNIVFECGITKSLNGQLQHEHYLVEEHYKNKKNYDLQFEFGFGQTKIISMNELIVILRTSLENADYLIGHGLLSEYLVLQQHGLNIFDFTQLKCLDTQSIFREKFNAEDIYATLSLINLLRVLDIAYVNLHNAGNDSAYTMMALIKIIEAVESPINTSRNITLISKRYKLMN